MGSDIIKQVFEAYHRALSHIRVLHYRCIELEAECEELRWQVAALQIKLDLYRDETTSELDVHIALAGGNVS
jgi:hypothetical protein